jgi:hypothetical protein
MESIKMRRDKMKKTFKIFLLVAIIFGMLLSFSLEKQNLRAEPPKVIDYSNITLPRRTLPSTAKVTKEEIVEKLTKKLQMCKEGKEVWNTRFPDGPIPTRIQCVTLTYEEFVRLFIGNKDASVLTPQDKLYILVVIDIEKPLREIIPYMSVPSEQMELWEKQGLLNSNKPFIYQEYQLIDPETGIVFEQGYNKVKVILSKQD